MGSHFALIDDALVVPLADNLQGPVCDGCGKREPQYFLFNGPAYYIALGLRGRLMPSAIEEYGMKRACLACTKRSFRGFSPRSWAWGWQGLRASAKADRLWQLRRLMLARDLGRTPQYASFEQRWDWPVCCGACCEYLGYPVEIKEAHIVAERDRYWEAGLDRLSPLEENPEVVSSPATELNRFGCKRCGARYYTYQRS